MRIRNLRFFLTLCNTYTAIALCNKYSTSASELMNQMDAFLVDNECESMTLELLGKFEQQVKNSKNVRVFY
jgi:hypothetical protein